MMASSRPRPVSGPATSRARRKVIVHSDAESSSNESVNVNEGRQTDYETSKSKLEMVEILPHKSHGFQGKGRTSSPTQEIGDHHKHRRRRRRSSVGERIRNHTTSPEKPDDETKPRRRRRSSASSGVYVYKARSQSEDVALETGRRKSSVDDGIRVYKTSPEKPGSMAKVSRSQSSASLPIHARRTSAPERIKSARPLRSETQQRARSRNTASSRRENIEITNEDDGEENTPTVRLAPRRRSNSVRERSTRPTLVRSSTSAGQKSKITLLPTVKEEPKSQALRPAQKPAQRSTSVFGNFFGPPRPAVPEAKVTCLTCMDDVVLSKAPKLACGHRLCSSCLRRIFTMSVTDPAHMPPKCCTEECIPLKHVDKMFDIKFKMRWNRKYHEYTTKNRIYCPAKGCGSWIPPKDITRDKDGRKYGACKKCRTMVCAKCNGKRHKSKECPKDDATQEFAEMAKSHGWQRCYNCSATVELKEGCNHMTCRCTAQFCMICGAKWKSCDCPWFNYATVEADRLNHWNIPQIRAEMARGGDVFAQPRAYHEELERRREQERRDEEFARRLQGVTLEYNGQAGAGAGWADWAAWAAPPAPNPLRPDFGRAVLTPRALPVQQSIVRTGPGTNLHTPPGLASPSAASLSAATETRPARSTPRRNPSTATPHRLAAVQTPHSNQSPAESDAESTPSRDRRSAVLAGLTRMSDSGRVDAWRRYVSGEPLISPL